MRDMSYSDLKKMVSFFYTTDYDDDLLDVNDRQSQSYTSLFQLHARMFALGDRYDIQGLRDVASKKYSSVFASDREDYSKLLESIYYVYEGTPASIKQLRHVACGLMRKAFRQGFKHKDFANLYEKLFVDLPEFTTDLLKLYVQAPLQDYCHTCESEQEIKFLMVMCRKCSNEIKKK